VTLRRAAGPAVALSMSMMLLLVACGGSNPAKNPSLAAGATTVAAASSTTSTVEATSTSSAAASTTSTSAAATTTTAGGAAPCSPSGTSLKLTAQSIQFSTSCLAAPANKAFTILFNNQDANTPHNVAIFSADPTSHPDAKVLFRGDLVTGVASSTYQVAAIPAGSYFFHCDVHPTIMTGTFVVK
jgi:Cupredoxin-like domain